MTRADKARIARAAAIQQMDLTQFVTTAALREADAVIAQVDTVRVSMRYYRRILALLEDPPAPNTRLKEAWIYLAMSMLTLARVAKNSFQTSVLWVRPLSQPSCRVDWVSAPVP